MDTFPTYDTVDLFAGPGGWDIPARELGLRVMGLEFEKNAHATRRAAGLHTIRDSVTNWGPANFPSLRHLIGSPPCQTFSIAGKGAGRAALDLVRAAVLEMGAGQQPDQSGWTDERTGLVLEPLRWALEAIALGRPMEWIVLEQVPTVLPVWETMALVLEAKGYHVKTAILNAEQYGVPQTRRRAVLIAHRDHPVEMPTPTHSRYYSRDKARLDPGVRPWVSMAEALGWGMSARPSMTVTGGGATTGGAEPFGNGARQGMRREMEEGAWEVRRNYGAGMVERHGDRPGRSADEPCFVLDGKARCWTWEQRSNYSAGGPGTAEERGRTMRGADEPSVTLTAKGFQWVSNAQENATVRNVEEPAPTVTGGHDSADRHWAYDRPATTVVGSFSPDTIAAPGYRVSAADGSRQNAAGSVRVTYQEAATLQSFPEGYPWQGSKSAIHQQVGNAIPPLLARAVLEAVL